MKHAVTLEVHQSLTDDVYHDRTRIPEMHRGGIREGRIVRISVNGNRALLEVRGLVGERRAVIRLAERDRNKLTLTFKSSYSFVIWEVGWPGQPQWAWYASDSASRIAARLGLLGLILGFLGLAAPFIQMVLEHAVANGH